MVKRLHIRVYGRVQGVGFRFAAARKAKELGLKGWVRNCDDGCVETEVEGEEEAVEKYQRWCKKGSMFARVKRVEEEFTESKEQYAEFQIV